jgi:curved DNA-binding protein CbpA
MLARCSMRRSVSSVKGDPFAALGLPARADLPDEEVRAAWKRIAAATHPDREDGGDAARYAAAAAA